MPPYQDPPSHDKTVKKVRFTLLAVLGGVDSTERKLVESHVSYLESYFKNVNDIIQKNTHPGDLKVAKEDAELCVIHTYLVISDIMRLIPKTGI